MHLYRQLRTLGLAANAFCAGRMKNDNTMIILYKYERRFKVPKKTQHATSTSEISQSSQCAMVAKQSNADSDCSLLQKDVGSQSSRRSNHAMCTLGSWLITNFFLHNAYQVNPKPNCDPGGQFAGIDCCHRRISDSQRRCVVILKFCSQSYLHQSESSPLNPSCNSNESPTNTPGGK